jgi:hypothetical protein
MEHVISHEFAELGYTFTDDDGVAYFDYKSQDGANYKVGFSLMRYHPSDGKDDYPASDNVASGAYIFKPIRSDTSKHPYSTSKSVDSFKGKVVNAMVLQYASDDKEIYTVIIRMVPGSKLVEFEVKLHGIPVDDKLGKEVVANWQVIGFDNDSTFYTDSNGLEMQKRILNYRPDWTLVTDEQ